MEVCFVDPFLDRIWCPVVHSTRSSVSPGDAAWTGRQLKEAIEEATDYRELIGAWDPTPELMLVFVSFFLITVVFGYVDGTT